MTAKKDTRKFVLFDSYGDPVYSGDKSGIEEFIEDLVDYDGEDAANDFKLYELGAQTALTVEKKVEVFIG